MYVSMVCSHCTTGTNINYHIAQKSDDLATQSDTKSSMDPDTAACEYHIQSTRRALGPSLEALGCICRALFARNLELCCSTQARASFERTKIVSRGQLSRSSSTRSSIASSCCPPTSKQEAGTTGLKKRCHPKMKVGTCRKSCSSPRRSSASSRGCCDDGEKLHSRVRHCEDDCCADDNRVEPNTPTKTTGSRTRVIDIENGPSTSEHIILSVQGMTCSGCETKAFRSLSTIPAIVNLQVSLLLARAEFDLDQSVISVTDVIAQIERTTEFTCEKITNNGQQVDVMVDGNPKAILDQDPPIGLISLELLDKQTIRIHYDGKQIGARDLLERGFDRPLRLGPLRPHPSISAGNKHVWKTGLMTLLSAIFTIPVLVFAWAPLPEHKLAYNAASLALATIVQVVIAGPFYPSALKSLLFSRVIEMDLLIVLSTSAAYVFSVVAFGYLVNGHPLSTGQFFETSTLLVTLIMLGRFVSALARQKAIESISVRALQPATALLVSETGATDIQIDARLLQYGDMFKVSPETRIPTDGTVIQGSSEVDESMVTGEAHPVHKKAKSAVIAGSMNGQGSLKVLVTRLPGDNTISAIANMVDEAKLSKPKTQELADRVAGYFVPVIVTLTIITFVIWIAIGIKVRGESSSEAAIQAITFGIAVLIVSCPCAIGLAVPMVIVIAGGVAAEHGIIFKTAQTIENARKATHVVFDKTGTLTQGQLSVAAERYIEGSKSTADSYLLGLISNIKHPVSVAVSKHLKSQGVTPTPFASIQTLPGKGVEGIAEDGTVIKAGNSRWLNLTSSSHVEHISSQCLTVFCIVISSKPYAFFGLSDSLRPEAKSVTASLLSRNISVSILSGDEEGPVRSIATALGVPFSQIQSRCSPADKQTYIRSLLSASPSPGTKSNTVLFIGDGTNDAPALATASIGIHINEGTEVAGTAADAILLRPNLMSVLTLIGISRAAYRRIVFNFTWAFIYNIFAILLAAGGFVHVRIPPQYAGLGEIVSVLPVIGIALGLKWSRFEGQ